MEIHINYLIYLINLFSKNHCINILYTEHYTLYTEHYTVYTIYYTMYTIHYTMYTIQYMYTICMLSIQTCPPASASTEQQ